MKNHLSKMQQKPEAVIKTLMALIFVLLVNMMAIGQAEGKWYKVNASDCLLHLADEGLTKLSWTGTCQNGYANGHGKMEAWDNDLLVYEYVGNVAEGRMNGKGLFTIVGSGVYEGDFKAGEMHGNGKLSTEMLVYEGGFMDGMIHGKGRLKFANGDEYTGDFKFGAEDGNGVFTFANGTRYKGDFKNGNAHGAIIIEYANGDRYEGDVYENEYHGSGKLIVQGEYTYEGVFEDGLPQGEGVMITEKGNKAVGEFRNGELYNGEYLDAATGEKLGVVAEGVVKRIDEY